ncbi:hypothetical protein BZL29_6470 [Mycobacterium kansasii]|uniref:Uncharacterized protein n=1 Tax=Mycobacterium kansasii TaxID=1768 RepID=A0A1V3WTF4_MYCKA|nr:hypothetical protein BZL29_6470 [Mycobacterium kansasii]
MKLPMSEALEVTLDTFAPNFSSGGIGALLTCCLILTHSGYGQVLAFASAC